MDIDARFVHDLVPKDRINVIQLVAHIGIADGMHYYVRAINTNTLDKLHPMVAHEAAHVHFSAMKDEYNIIVREFMSKVYCRAFVSTIAHLVLLDTPGKMEEQEVQDFIRPSITPFGSFELKFLGFEDDPSKGIVQVSLNSVVREMLSDDPKTKEILSVLEAHKDKVIPFTSVEDVMKEIKRREQDGK